MSINVGDIVTLHYTLKDENNEIIEKSSDKKPISFKIGSKNDMFGIGKDLRGLKKGDTKEFKIPPHKGFGERRKDLYQEVPKDWFKGKTPLSQGMAVELRFEKDDPRLAIVDKISNDTVTLDLNHPLAGQTVIFDIEIVDILKDHA